MLNSSLTIQQQRTLEELDYVFAVPMRTHMKFMVSQYAPWWFKHYIFRRKIPTPQLYKFDYHDYDDRETLTSSVDRGAGKTEYETENKHDLA